MKLYRRATQRADPYAQGHSGTNFKRLD